MPLRIAQVVPVAYGTGQDPLNSVERHVSHLCDALVDAGQQVTLFASADIQTKARLVETASRPSGVPHRVLRRGLPDALGLVGLEQALARSAEFDVLHTHLGLLALPLLRRSTLPAVMTVHGELTLEVKQVYQSYPDIPLILTSGSHMLGARALNWMGCVDLCRRDTTPYIDEATRSILASMHIHLYRGVIVSKMDHA